MSINFFVKPVNIIIIQPFCTIKSLYWYNISPKLTRRLIKNPIFRFFPSKNLRIFWTTRIVFFLSFIIFIITLVVRDKILRKLYVLLSWLNNNAVYVTITWGAAASTATVATIVNNVKTIRQSLSRTMAANFQSFSMAALSSSSLILSVMIFISFKIRLNSLKFIKENKVGDYQRVFL